MDELVNNDLHPTEFVFLYYMVQGNEIPSILYTGIDLKKLEEKGFIKLTDCIVLREKSYELFHNNASEISWLKFFNTFPIKVSNERGGTRPLRPTSLDAKMSMDSKKKYLLYVGTNTILADKIQKILEAEMEMRRTSGTFPFMNNMLTWLNQRNWEKYEYLLADTTNKQEGKDIYGGKLL